MKKALIFDQYLDTLGGGERYTLSFAKVLSDNGYSVEVAWSNQQILSRAGTRFDLDFSKITTSDKAYQVLNSGNIFDKFKLTRGYDLIFWVSDGSFPYLFSKNNLVHFQVPFKKVKSNFLKNFLVTKFIYNSNFTKSVMDQHFPKFKGVVIYPPVDIEKFKTAKKTDLIIGVGRFGAQLNNKRQDVLINAFRKFYNNNKNYKLALLGGLNSTDNSIDSLKKLASGLPVEFKTNPDFNTIRDYCAKARFFWHATGYKVSESTNPEKVEHFGITTVEAISAGCIPIVIAKGGQKEIISTEELLCDSIDEIADKTQRAIDSKFTVNINIDKYSYNSFVQSLADLSIF